MFEQVFKNMDDVLWKDAGCIWAAPKTTDGRNEADLAGCMVALPSQLFYSTQIPVCLWFLAKNKAADTKRGFRDRHQQTLVFESCIRCTLHPTLWSN